MLDKVLGPAEFTKITREFLSSESREQTISLKNGLVLRMLRETAPVRLSFAAFHANHEEQCHGIVFDGAKTRPNGFPADFPFVPECSGSYMETRTPLHTRTATWTDIEALQDVLHSLLQTLTDQGWVERKSEAVTSPHVESHRLERGGAGLTVFGSSAGHKVLMLVEKPTTA